MPSSFSSCLSFVLAGLPLAATLFISPCAAQVPDSLPASPAADQAEPTRRWDVYLSGYAYHNRHTYSEAKVRQLNEKAWGGGLGWTWRTARGNDESWYAMAIRDSKRNQQYMAGYAYQWIYPVPTTNLEAGLGLTALVIKRQDWFDGQPFPAVLPVASVGTERAKFLVTYVPRLPRIKGKGEIALFVLKFSF